MTAKGIAALKQDQNDENFHVTVTALDLYRYMVDQQVKRVLKINDDPVYKNLKDGFDVLLTDGETKCMAAIHPSLANDVSKGLILPFTLLKITSWRNWYNDQSLDNVENIVRIILILKFEVLASGFYPGITGAYVVPGELKQLEKRPFSPLCNALDGKFAIFKKTNFHMK